MNFGALQGLVNGTEQVVFDREVTGSAVSSISTGNILNGDEDGWYTVIFRWQNLTASKYPIMTFNNDTGANYGQRGIQAIDTSVADNNATAEPYIMLSRLSSGAGQTVFVVLRLYAKSGSVRLCNHVGSYGIGGTSVAGMYTMGNVWNNTADNLTSMQFSVYGGGSHMDVGTRIIILKSNNFTNGTPTGSITTPYIKGSWVRVGTPSVGTTPGSIILPSAASSVTFSGLDGDRDVVYYLASQWKSTATDQGTLIRPNNSSTEDTYGLQYVLGMGSTIEANRYTTFESYFNVWNGTQINDCSQANNLIYAKSGFVRPCITSLVEDINGTFIGGLKLFGQSWNNTADNITSLVVFATNGNWAAGSQFELYALRPNG